MTRPESFIPFLNKIRMEILWLCIMMFSCSPHSHSPESKQSQYLIKKDDKSWKEISTVKFDRHSKLKFDREIVDLWKQNISIWQSSISIAASQQDPDGNVFLRLETFCCPL